MSMSLYFLLLAAVCGASAQNFLDGRTVIVHLFEWKWVDIAEECERFLGPYGFAGVQVSPPNEHNLVWDPWRPWYERYQPIGYAINSRSGSRSEFKNMVNRCRAVGVLIYVDAVINHMAAFSYDFPNVPYSSSDFNVPRGNCPTGGNINDYNNVYQVRNCDLVGLNDIMFGSVNGYYCNQKVAAYLNDLVGLGVAGFRIDAAKHMWPGDLEEIKSRLNNCAVGGKPYIYQEVIDLSDWEAVHAEEYVHIGDVTEFRYCEDIRGIGEGWNAAKYYSNFGESWGMLPSHQALVFVDNHDNQRGHGGAGDILTHMNSVPYKKALAFGMAWDYGTFRIMSSYYFSNDDDSPPAYSDGSIISPSIKSDGTCGNGWVCEHRWRQIRNMACFRNAAGTNGVQNWYDNGNNFIAFSRGSRAFFALNNEGYTFSEWLYTGLPAGDYCDVISGDPTGWGCTGETITVNSSGYAYISIGSGEDSMIAIHVGATKSSSANSCSW
ncbi:alpha-amylase A-like [Diadema antillarum]|uniref:alpha-amylase A-like n=1 Tax=Diadema antillarum TaxID=105358 RepID=UPI003A8C417D